MVEVLTILTISIIISIMEVRCVNSEIYCYFEPERAYASLVHLHDAYHL
jgi:hypothetical protein